MAKQAREQLQDGAVRTLRALDKAAYAGWQSSRKRLTEVGWPRLRRLGLRAAIVLVLGIGVWLWVRRAGPQSLTQLTSSDPAAVVHGAAISPDGGTLAYSDAAGLHLLALETGVVRASPLSGTMVVEDLAWSPDGSRIYFVARRDSGFAGSLWELPVGAGEPRELRDRVRSPAVSPDGSTIAFVQEATPGTSIWTLRADGSDARPVAQDRRYGHSGPTWSKDGRLAFTRIRDDHGEAQIVTLPAGGGEPVPAVLDFDRRTPACFAPDGRLVFGRTERSGASLWSVGIDPDTGEPDDEPVKILEQAGVAFFSALGVDQDGERLAFVSVRTQVDTYLADLDPQDGKAPLPGLRRLASGTGDHYPIAWSADSASLLLRLDHDATSQVVEQPVAGGDHRWVAAGVLLARAPDGSLLFEAADGTGLMRTSPASDEPQLVARTPRQADKRRSALRCPLRPDADCVVAVEEGNVLRFRRFDPRAPAGRGDLLAGVGLNERDYGWNVSPDGKRVAVVNGGRTIRLVTLSTGGVRQLTIQPSVYTHSVAWSPDGNALYVTGMILHSAGGYALYRVDLAGRTELLWQSTERWFAEPVPSPDGKALALASRTVEADVWMVENF